ncbi:MAG: hypothetical protein RMJ39_08340 [Deltaproteobacteria bacterium]|nr:hypothetical protein [Deltaproteobacteria bacterium]
MQQLGYNPINLAKKVTNPDELMVYRILVVEDERWTCEIVRSYLEREGFVIEVQIRVRTLSKN